MKSKNIWLTLCLTLTITATYAQRGNTRIQLAAQMDIPVGDLATGAKVGRGFAIKGLLGFGNAPQQLTLEAGNNFFSLKDKYIIKDVQVNYSSWPVYLGYRRYFNKVYTEGQAGFAVTKMAAFRTDTITGSVQDSGTYLSWAFALGYQLDDFNFEARFQSIAVKNSPDVDFIGFRIAYSLPFFRKKEEGR